MNSHGISRKISKTRIVVYHLGRSSRKWLGALALLALTTACGNDENSPPVEIIQVEGGTILFSSVRDGDWEIFTMNSDGSDERKLTDNLGYDWAPVWSPDGSQIVFTSDHLDGEIQQTGSFVNGEWVRETIEKLQEPEIFLMDADGSHLRALTDNLGVDGGPAWSPDGTKVAFHSDLSEMGTEIYSINLDGTGLHQLTQLGGHNWDPAWSPGGQRIAFGSLLSDWMLYAMDGDGESLQLIEGAGVGWKPAWSPAGNQIAFSSKRNGNWDIFVMNADGTEVQQLTSHPADEHDPVWSPSGQHLAFGRALSGTVDILVMNSDGSGVFSTGQSGFASDWKAAQ